MSTFESSIRTIPYTQDLVYKMLSNPANLERIKDKIPAEEQGKISFDNDTISFQIHPVGEIKLCIIEREEPKTIKFEAQQSPLPFYFWIQLLPVTETSCKLKLTLKAELNPFIKGMVKKPLAEGIEKMADILEAITYE